MLLRDIVNGAMLANCVNIAVSNALRRDMLDQSRSGVTIDDVKLAVERLQTQSNTVSHDLEDINF